jgi:hypothetical protein
MIAASTTGSAEGVVDQHTLRNTRLEIQSFRVIGWSAAL